MPRKYDWICTHEDLSEVDSESVVSDMKAYRIHKAI